MKYNIREKNVADESIWENDLKRDLFISWQSSLHFAPAFYRIICIFRDSPYKSVPSRTESRTAGNWYVKMSLSKPTNIMYNLIGAYLEQLYSSPLRTKAVTSCIIAALGNMTSQKLSGAKKLNQDSVLAFALFGLLFGGPVPHYFYTYIRLFVKHPLGILLIERLIYTPCFQALALYLLAIFEGKTHQVACTQMQRLYLPTLRANLQYLTLFHFINIKYVPPMFRVLVVNLIGFAWVIYVANKRTTKISKKPKTI